MKYLRLILILIIPLSLYASDTKVIGDIDCDGKNDTAVITQTSTNVSLVVYLGNGSKSNELVFGLGKPGLQDSLCGPKAYLGKEELVNDLSEMLGENPEGYMPSKTCIGLNINGGECDSMHIFWNHKTNELNWWRL